MLDALAFVRRPKKFSENEPHPLPTVADRNRQHQQHVSCGVPEHALVEEEHGPNNSAKAASTATVA
jgi:hypothetical protein